MADDGGLELWLDGCRRKRREPSDREPLYVWTNIELDWEEHHYVEAYYFRSSGELKVAINGKPILERMLPRSPLPPSATASVLRYSPPCRTGMESA